jgi:hypothetical protein
MANAIHTLCAQPDLPQCKIIVINSDCLNSFRRISLKNQDTLGRKVAQLLRKLRNLTALNGVVMPEFEFRHVRAHTDNGDARSKVNDWCDTEAKKWARMALNEIKEKND